MGARSVYGGRHLDRPVAFYKLSWLEKQTEGGGGGVGGSAREKKTKKGIELMPKAAALNTVVFTSLL